MSIEHNYVIVIACISNFTHLCSTINSVGKLFDISLEGPDERYSLSLNPIFVTQDELNKISSGFLESESFEDRVDRKIGVDGLERYEMFRTLNNSVLALLQHDIMRLDRSNNPSLNYALNGIAFEGLRVTSMKFNNENSLDCIDNFSLIDFSERYLLMLESVINHAKSINLVDSWMLRAIEEDELLLKIHRDLALFPTEEEGSPVDRGIIHGASLLTAIGCTIVESCEGHDLFDSAGVRGAVAPYLLLSLNKSELAEFESVLNEKFCDSLEIISLQVSANGLYKLESGNRVVLDSFSGSDRSLYRDLSLKVLNSFIKEIYLGRVGGG